MRSDVLDFKLITLTIRWRAAQGAEWWRSRPAHNPQRSNGAGPPCHPRTPPKLRSPRPNLHSLERSMGMAHERRMGAKGALTERPPGTGAPTGHPRGDIPRALWSTDFFFFWRRQSGSSDLFWYMFWAQGNSVCKVNWRGWLPNSEPVPYSGKPKEFSKGEGVPLWWGGGGTRKATVPERTLALRVPAHLHPSSEF